MRGLSTAEKNPSNLNRIMPAKGKVKEIRFCVSLTLNVYRKITVMTTVFVNNKACPLEPNSSLNTALEQNGVTNQKGIAVAVNNAVVPKAEWQTKILNENDKITIIRATQGG